MLTPLRTLEVESALSGRIKEAGTPKQNQLTWSAVTTGPTTCTSRSIGTRGATDKCTKEGNRVSYTKKNYFIRIIKYIYVKKGHYYAWTLVRTNTKNSPYYGSVPVRSSFINYSLRAAFTVRGSKRRGLRITASPTCRVIVAVVVVEARYSHIVFV